MLGTCHQVRVTGFQTILMLPKEENLLLIKSMIEFRTSNIKFSINPS